MVTYTTETWKTPSMHETQKTEANKKLDTGMQKDECMCVMKT